jgi:organic radical activating enzyme
MSLKSALRNILPQPSAHTAAGFERNELAQTVMQRRNCIQTLDYHITEHCNLNCKCCGTYAPLAKEEYTDLATFQSDLQQLSKLVGNRLLSLHLLGGEPLLHPEIEQFVIAARQTFPEIYIDVVSNGLLARKMPESFWNTMREQNVVMQFSAYPINLDYVELVKFVREKGVQSFTFKGDQRINVFTRKALDPMGQQNMYASHLHCAAGNTTQLRQGKLYRCPTAAYICNLNRKLKQEDPSRPDEMFKLHELDALDIYRAKDAQEVFEFLNNAIPFCRYCACGSITQVPWEKSEKKSSEWVDF